MSLNIESAKPEHIPAILALLREFAEYESLLDYLEVTGERMQAALFGEGAVPSVAEAIVAVLDDEPVGYAVFYPNFATFRGQRGLYLEDIYIKPAHRRGGTGEKMLRHIARLAKERGYERIDFMVLDWNAPAISFYKKLGAGIDESERHFKFTDDVFNNLASPQTNEQ
jgi:ribosomal protein S18 acetylase RimI-like enzyme